MLKQKPCDKSEEKLIKKLNRWKDGVQSKVIKVNMNETKVMISRERHKWVKNTARWLRGVCGRGDGRQCTNCHKWV